MDHIKAEISKCQIFKDLEEAAVINLLDQHVYQVKHYNKGRIIASRKETCKFLLILAEGSAKGEMLNVSGKVIKIEDLIAPRALAPAFLFGTHNRYPVDIVATSPSTVAFFPKETVIKIIQQNDVFLTNYLDALSNRAQFLSNKIYFLSFKTIKEKLANYFLENSQPYSNSFRLTQSQQQLSELFGVTRPSLSRGIQELEDEGLIKVDQKNVSLLNREALKRLLE